ncbi:protein FAM81A-like [Oscarella lobularis]|uniref:protein FAM81A-like n=1 Tax=Oscarella lobularis TaxID=121494 RepID=UPI0033133FBD
MDGDLSLVPLSRDDASPRYRHVNRPSSRRLDRLEDRVRQQEFATQTLVDRAIAIKEDLLENRAKTHEAWHGERRERVLLRDHVRTITAAVKRIAADIECLERDQRDALDRLHANDGALRKIGHAHVSSSTRLARCEADLSRTTSDLKGIEEKLARLESQSAERYSALNSNFEKMTSKISHFESELTAHALRLDSFVRQQASAAEDVRAAIASDRRWMEMESERIVQLTGKLELANSIRDQRLSAVESQLAESAVSVRALEQRQERTSARGTRLREHSETSEARSKAFVEELRRECGEGFKAVKDSIESMRQVLDDKRELLEQKIEDQLRRLKTVVVL